MHHSELALIELGLRSRSVDFSKILSKTGSEIKATSESLESSEAAIDEMTEESATLADEMKRLEKEVKEMDKAVAEATEQRKEEHGEFITFQTENGAALQLIEKAKNKLFKFYRPNQYKEAPKQELTAEEKILAASGRSDMIATAAPDLIAGTTIAAVQTQLYAQLRETTSDDASAAPPCTGS